ncbi:MAG TPA: zinc-binding dehydrogenase [Actinomycetota bacterium]|nr:zinc-binding dehydrogenase [Actinomycetota bacterium]
MADTMRAARFTGADRKLEIKDVPVPKPGPLEVVVKVEACGICLSDVHLLDGGIPPVIDVVTPGHESCGTVHETGELVTGWKKGDRVIVMAGRNCGTCDRCATGQIDKCRNPQLMGFHYDGAWAEYTTVPFYGLTRVPDNVPSEQAAILVDAVATPYAALTERAKVRPSESVGLWGVGGLGTHAVQIARIIGAAPIVAIDPLPSARDRALKVGADVAIDPTTQDVNMEILAVTDGSGLDVAVDLVGSNKVLSQAVSCTGRQGRAVMVGLSLDPIELGPGLLFGVQSTSLLGHLGYQKQHLEQLVKLVSTGRLDLTASISDVMPLEQVADGVRRLSEKDGDPVRLIVAPNG